VNALGQPPLVCLITPGEATPDNFAEKKREIIAAVAAAVDARVSIVQVREKSLTARLLSELVDAVAATARGSATNVLVNDRGDIALGCGADGVHLAATSLPVDAIRGSFPREFVIGVSTHTIDEVQAAKRGGADFAVFGPVFATPGKGEPQGLETLARVCDAVRPFPVLALGGIDEWNCDSALAAGASGIAAIRALNDAESLRAIYARLAK
jgi:thiamine-phosphate pyrophosphorylase